MQNGFMNEETQNLKKKIKSLIEKKLFDYVIFTQFINPDGGPYETLLDWKRFKSSPEIDIVEELQPYCQNLFKKNYYTLFTNELEEFLKKNQIISGEPE